MLEMMTSLQMMATGGIIRNDPPKSGVILGTQMAWRQAFRLTDEDMLRRTSEIHLALVQEKPLDCWMSSGFDDYFGGYTWQIYPIY